MTATAPEASHRPPEVRLLDDARGGLDDLKRLAVLEVDLVKAEAGTALKRLALTALLLVGSLLFLYAAFIFVITLIAYVLGAFDHWWGLGITVLALLLITGLLALTALRIFNRARHEVMATVRSIKGDVEWLLQLATQRTDAS